MASIYELQNKSCDLHYSERKARISLNAEGFSGIASKLTKKKKFTIRDLGIFSLLA